MIMKFQWANVVNKKYPKRYIRLRIRFNMACFCGCETYVKNEDGFKIACVKCEHGPQNHDDAFRDAARKNESQSQKRDADFG